MLLVRANAAHRDNGHAAFGDDYAASLFDEGSNFAELSAQLSHADLWEPGRW